MPRTRDDKAESASRGRQLYENIRPQVEDAYRGEVVAIDLETGRYEISGDTISAARLLRTYLPDARIWFVRVGHEALYRFGPRILATPA